MHAALLLRSLQRERGKALPMGCVELKEINTQPKNSASLWVITRGFRGSLSPEKWVVHHVRRRQIGLCIHYIPYQKENKYRNINAVAPLCYAFHWFYTITQGKADMDKHAGNDLFHWGRWYQGRIYLKGICWQCFFFFHLSNKKSRELSQRRSLLLWGSFCFCFPKPLNPFKVHDTRDKGSESVRHEFCSLLDSREGFLRFTVILDIIYLIPNVGLWKAISPLLGI